MSDTSYILLILTWNFVVIDYASVHEVEILENVYWHYFVFVLSASRVPVDELMDLWEMKIILTYAI